MVVKQPVEDGETEACREAADYCPMGALHALEPELAARAPARTEKR